MKLMDKRVIKQKRAAKLIVLERQILSQFDSPFVAGVRYAFQTPTKLHIVTDLYAGGDLEALVMRRGPLTEASAKFLTAQLVIAVRALHERGIMHRDIKPANILLDGYG